MKNALKELRKAGGFTTCEMCTACNIRLGHFISLERQDGANPELTTAYAIARILGKSVYEIWPDATKGN